MTTPLNTYQTKRLKTPVKGKSKTKQQFKAESDINTIVNKYKKTGVITHYARYQGSYGDATGLDYKNAMDVVSNANTLFLELPASVRDRFNGDPAKFLDFVQDPKNADELTEMGFREPLTPVEKRAVAEDQDERQPAEKPPETPPEAQ